MAVFRVERNKGYIVMSNQHLRNRELSLKAKGLLSQMLSLPEDWDYTLAGLSYINLESIDAIRTAIWELEKAGYITRRQGRDEKGKMTAIEYTIYEQPQSPELVLARVLENDSDVQNWLRPAPRKFNITYNRGSQYCEVASRWGKANGYKEWQYLFIPSQKIMPNSSFLQLAKQFHEL